MASSTAGLGRFVPHVSEKLVQVHYCAGKFSTLMCSYAGPRYTILHGPTEHKPASGMCCARPAQTKVCILLVALFLLCSFFPDQRQLYHQNESAQRPELAGPAAENGHTAIVEVRSGLG
jgi:hypothetical protein